MELFMNIFLNKIYVNRSRLGKELGIDVKIINQQTNNFYLNKKTKIIILARFD